MSIQPVIAIHGGAWAIPDNLAHASVEGVKIAARVGFDISSGLLTGSHGKLGIAFGVVRLI
jgi:hypothetical protein